MNTQVTAPKISVFGLVRDKDNNPVFDDWNNIPEEIAHALSKEDLLYIEGKK